MKSRARVLVLCLLCVARASTVLPSEEIAEFKARSATEDLSNISMQETNGTDERAADKLRDKRALGLLLSGLAQIFGYTVMPIQIATLPNPNTMTTAAMSSTKSQVATPPMNTTPAPRQRETIRFTGVLNFGNNSDILGHLQRYEQIFHGPRNNMTMTTVRAPPRPMPPPQVTLDPRINSPTKPPLLTPFFVKIPLPIAPELLPAAIPEDLTLSYPTPAITIVSDSNAEPPTRLPPIRKEQETVYRNNGNSEQYTLEQKEIYDEKDVRKPMSKNTHQLFIDEPSGNKQQEAREERTKERERYRNRENPTHCRDDETKERYKDREEEIDNRNRQQTSKYKPTEKKRPTHDDEEDEDSAERYEEREDEPKSSRGSSRQPPEKDDRNKAKDYPDDDGNDERDDSENLDKYTEAGYNRQLPIGDYFHEGNPEIIRDSYGEVLDDKRLEDDRLDEYINMFKHPNIGVYTSQEVRNSDDASGEDGKDAPSADGYDEHLTKLQKLREEYTPLENKYEEYDLNDEHQGERNDRRSERNRITLRGSKRPKSDSASVKENGRVKSIISNNSGIPRNDVRFNKAQQEIAFEKYTPLIIPVRYIDVNDKVQQATTQQLKYKEVNKSTNNQFSQNKMEPTVTLKEKLPLHATSEKIRHLHEGEFQKELQLTPPFFDYAYDNTQPESIIIQRHLENSQNYQRVVKNDVGRNANNDESSKERSDYLGVVNNPAYSYRYPQNIYYYSNEVANPQNQASHLNAEGTHTQEQIYVPQQSGNQFIQANPNFTEYNLNETTKNSYNYYYQPQEIPTTVIDRYRYIFGEQNPQTEESLNFNAKNQNSNADNWSNRSYRPQLQSDQQSFSDLPQTIANYNVQDTPLERSHNTQSREQQELQKQQKNTEKTEIPIQQLIPKNFNDPQSAHDFFGFSKDDYSFRDESNGRKVAEENDRTTKESEVFVAPEPTTNHYDESIMKYDDELENNPEKAKVKEYRNRVATLRVSEQRQTRPNGPIYYVDFIRNI